MPPAGSAPELQAETRTFSNTHDLSDTLTVAKLHSYFPWTCWAKQTSVCHVSRRDGLTVCFVHLWQQGTSTNWLGTNMGVRKTVAGRNMTAEAVRLYAPETDSTTGEGLRWCIWEIQFYKHPLHNIFTSLSIDNKQITDETSRRSQVKWDGSCHLL